MKSILIANVGNRDGKYDNQDIKPPRLYGKDYLERFEAVHEHLTFPIIGKGLDCVFQELKNQPLDCLILFYTDQNQNEVEDRHYQADTLYFADLIEKLAAIRLPRQIRRIIKIRIPRTPNDYDFTYEFFSDELEKIEQEIKPERIFLSPAGGIPACNMNLLLQGSRIFNRRAVTLLIPENPDKPAKLQKLGELLNRENNRRIVRRLLDEYDFGGVAELLENETDSVSRSLLALARSVQYRLYFDFDSALKYLDDVNPEILQWPVSGWKNFSSIEQLVDQIKAELKAVKAEANPIHGGLNELDSIEAGLELHRRLNAEVLLNAKIKWLSKQYIDFLGRIFRLQEGVLRWVFEKETGYSADSHQFPNDFSDLLNQNPDFVVYLNENPINGRTPVACHLNRGTLLLYLQFITQVHSEYKPVLKHCNKLDHLAALRNKCALAHGNAAINDRIILEKYGPDVWRNLSALSEAFLLDDHLPQIDCIREIILENF